MYSGINHLKMDYGKLNIYPYNFELTSKRTKHRVIANKSTKDINKIVKNN